MFDLTGKKAIVTGSSRGIGRGIALALARQGTDVIINYRSSQKEAEAVVEEIRKIGRDSLAIQADVSRKSEVEKMVAETVEKFGKIDVLVNNAGIAVFKPFDQLTEEDWDQTLAINLKSQFLCIKAIAPIMEKQKWGRIINIASIASGGVGVGFLNLAHYCASKGGVVALTEELAMELASSGINVNAVAPGVIDTDMTADFKKDPKIIEGLMARILKKRLGRPEDIGAVVAFLASDEADYITGATLYVDGGWLAG
ncbi:beta-ketoacyl-ACP reductase [Candidatus Shapirobacteria bacterium CG09_land_8_20_14_0_10_38_17]|uniref:Beta-ketoacyl-ACP reductase n=1 Tax=Candidatus Shapirobacteria bacterium CG09_land_8_20_14_0_10_38_17 TaxID=1974884 RepID=A0A2H0WS20_9BACT|nr:MAG: beta-ketoacyl-ACP reductase [Candidatus Shapirobacteria bacterium CG09_land_8_20_14_0_10_38_17]